MKIIDNDNIQVIKLELEIENTGHITNSYILKDKSTNHICVIDPAFDDVKIKQTINEMGGKLELVIITHSHADHIAALAKLVENEDVKVYVHELDYEGLYDKILNEEAVVKTKVLPVNKSQVETLDDKSVINLGSTVIKIIHTPGHTRGSICLVDTKNNILYSGDTIFQNSYGRTDLITGNSSDMKKTLDCLFNTYEDILVLPGHGEEFNLKDSKRKIRLLFAYKG